MLFVAGCTTPYDMSQTSANHSSVPPRDCQSGGLEHDDDCDPAPTATATETPSPTPTGSPIPILEFLFEENSGLVASNTGSFANATGTLMDGNSVVAGPVWSADVPPNGGAASLSFDGVNDWIRIPDDFDYTVDGTHDAPRLSALSIEAWVKPVSVIGQLVVWDDYGSPGVLLAVWDGRVEFAISTDADPGLGAAVEPGNLETGVWTHIAGVYDGATIRVYINGCLQAPVVATSGAIQDDSRYAPGARPAAIGADNESIPALNFEGEIDSLRVFAEPLSVEQLDGGYFADHDDCPPAN